MSEGEPLGIEGEGAGGEAGAEVNEAELAKVRENLAKGAQIRGQIQSSQQQQQRSAQMLGVLLFAITDTKLLGMLSRQLTEYHVDPDVLFLQFAPYVLHLYELEWYQQLHPEHYEQAMKVEQTFAAYTTYIAQIREQDEQLSAIGAEEYTDFMYRYAQFAGLIETTDRDDETVEACKTSLYDQFVN